MSALHRAGFANRPTSHHLHDGLKLRDAFIAAAATARRLGLRPGDYLQVEVAQGRVVFTPKTLVDKRLDQRIAESMDDFAQGRSYGPFESAEEMIGSLHRKVRTCRGSTKTRG